MGCRYQPKLREDLHAEFFLDSSVFQDAAKAYATPFHLYDERGIRQTARR